MAAEDFRLTIGQAKITVDGDELNVHQADAAVFTAEPELIDVDLYDLVAYDKIVNGWKVEVKLVFDDENYEGFKLALAGVKEITDTDSETGQTTTTGLTDSPSLKSLRQTAKEIVIHPADLPSTDQRFDITIFKAVPTGSFERTYGKEQSSYEVTLTGLARTADATQASNYFRIGTDLVGAQ
jgi:hypothetical protein